METEIVYGLTFTNASHDHEANALRASIELLSTLPDAEARARVASYLARRYQ